MAFQDICRTCESPCRSSKRSIFSADYLEDFSLVLRGHIDQEPSRSDPMPEWLCVKCQRDVKIGAAFIRQAVKSHAAGLAVTVKEEVLDDEPLEETVKIKEEPPWEEDDEEQMGENFEEIIHIQLQNKSKQALPQTMKLIRVPVAPITGTNKMQLRLKEPLPRITVGKSSPSPPPTQHTFETDFFPCKICNKSFTKRNALLTHIRTHKTQARFRCDHCDRTFKTSGPLKAHMTRHVGETVDCKICGKAFNRESFVYHMQREHEIEKPHSCQQCDRKFLHKNALYRHVKIVHTGVKHQCGICNKLYATNDSLKCHMNTHQETLPFPCPLCNRSFPVRGRLNLHLKMVHTKDDGIDRAKENVHGNESTNDLLLDIKIEEPDLEI